MDSISASQLPVIKQDIVATSLSGSDKPFGGCEAYLTKDSFAVYLKTEINSVQHFPAGVEAYAVNKVKEEIEDVLPEHEFFGTSTSTISSIQQENIDVAAPTFFSQQLDLGCGSFKLDSGCGTDQASKVHQNEVGEHVFDGSDIDDEEGDFSDEDNLWLPKGGLDLEEESEEDEEEKVMRRELKKPGVLYPSSQNDSYSILFEDEDVSKFGPHTQLREQRSLTWQHGQLFPDEDSQGEVSVSRRSEPTDPRSPLPLKRKKKPDSTDQLLRLATAYFKQPQTEENILAQGWAMKMKKLRPDQKRFAEK